MMTYLPAVLLIISGLVFAIKGKKLTIVASVCGAAIALLLLAGFGYMGLVIMTTFFVLGTVATSWKMGLKRNLGLAEAKSSRTAGQVFANAGCGAVLALIALFNPLHQGLYALMMAASFSSAAADTVSSELGNVYGRRFYNVLSFKKDKRGLDGVISLEGTLLGIAGSSIVAVVFYLFTGLGVYAVVIIIAGLAGNFMDSVLGASLERKHLIDNNVVNFCNTAFAALVSLLCSYVTG